LPQIGENGSVASCSLQYSRRRYTGKFERLAGIGEWRNEIIGHLDLIGARTAVLCVGDQYSICAGLVDNRRGAVAAGYYIAISGTPHDGESGACGVDIASDRAGGLITVDKEAVAGFSWRGCDILGYRCAGSFRAAVGGVRHGNAIVAGLIDGGLVTVSALNNTRTAPDTGVISYPEKTEHR
jgi:hypothetical protein